MTKKVKPENVESILNEQMITIRRLRLAMNSQQEIIKLHQDMLRDATNLEDLKGFLLNGPMYSIEHCPACEFLGKEKILENWTDIYVHRDPEMNNHITILMQYAPQPDCNFTFGEEFFKGINASNIKDESSTFQVAYEYYQFIKE